MFKLEPMVAAESVRDNSCFLSLLMCFIVQTKWLGEGLINPHTDQHEISCRSLLCVCVRDTEMHDFMHVHFNLHASISLCVSVCKVALVYAVYVFTNTQSF